tara:strand:+ start:344 stop:616 length:273 start_codon:yes stop_codon:yes gene_type:complete
MFNFKNILFIIILIGSQNTIKNNLMAENNSNSIIKIFCLESVKIEMERENLIYSDDFGNEVCNCYLENLSENNSHEESKSKCKIEKKGNT